MFDIQTPVMTLSLFRAAPRWGHLDRNKSIFGYIAKMNHAVIIIRTNESDFITLPSVEFDWDKSVYGYVSELIPEDAPKPRGKFVTLNHYVDTKSNALHIDR